MFILLSYNLEVLHPIPNYITQCLEWPVDISLYVVWANPAQQQFSWDRLRLHQASCNIQGTANIHA